MISRFWALFGVIIYLTFFSFMPVLDVSANGVVRPVWEQDVGAATLVMLTSPFPPSTGSLHIAMQLEETQGNESIIKEEIPLFLTIAPGGGIAHTESAFKVEELRLYRGVLDQYHTNVFIDKAGNWVFTVDLVIGGDKHTVSREIVVVDAETPKIPLLTIAFVVIVFTLAYLAWWIRLRRKS